MMVRADDADHEPRIDLMQAEAAAAVRRRLREIAMLIADAVTHPGIGVDLLQAARAQLVALVASLDGVIAAWCGVPVAVDEVPTAPLDSRGGSNR